MRLIPTVTHMGRGSMRLIPPLHTVLYPPREV